jgi:RNA recognition motif-containing protein
LEDLFHDYGTITRCEVKRGRGFGFVEFKEKKEAEDAMKELQNSTLNGAKIVIELAKGPKRDDKSKSNNFSLVTLNRGFQRLLPLWYRGALGERLS